jgi:DNA mismatch endonuclease, patch repair protein
LAPEDAQARRRTMQAVKSKNTQPEIAVRKLLHSKGYRFRLHRKDLPGKPDIIFPSRRKAIFINGCFWHGHDCARGSRIPKTNQDYWVNKVSRNKQRDVLTKTRLQRLGWTSLTVWECETQIQVTSAPGQGAKPLGE